MSKCITDGQAAFERKLLEVQVQLLYRQTWTGLTGVLIVALVATMAFWQVVPQWKLALWCGLSVLLTLARGGTLLAYQNRSRFALEIGQWARLHVFGTAVSALMWAVPPVYLWPEQGTGYQLVWPILILPLGAAAVATCYTWTASYVSFIVVSVAPLSLRFFAEGGSLMNLLGFLALFFIAVLLRAGRVMHSASVREFESGIHNEELNKDLREGLLARELLNEQLQEEIAERSLAETENVKLIRELQRALDEIKTLAGVIPICMHCKGIRDDKGDWNKLEQYISEHSDAQFSHGICADCLQKYYPDTE